MPSTDSSVKRKRISRASKDSAPESASKNEVSDVEAVSPEKPMIKKEKLEPSRSAREIFFEEEDNVDVNRGDQCLRSFTKAQETLSALIKDILESKQNNAPAKTMTTLKNDCVASFLQLKRLNREAQFRLKKVREVTSDRKLQIDLQHLQLQNLLYQAMHLDREIIKCRDFRSRHDNISLIPVEQFLKEVTPEVYRPDVAGQDTHQLTLARLTWELEQRVKLNQQVNKGQEDVQRSVDQIKDKREQLDSLRPQIKKIIESTKPVQKTLGLEVSKQDELFQLAFLLPPPLYVLFNQISSFASVRNKNIVVSIVGDRDEAYSVREMEKEKLETCAGTHDLDVEDDDEEDREDEELRKISKKKHRHSLSTGEDLVGSHMKPHCLTVEVTLMLKDSTDLKLSFQYLMLCKILTVKVSLHHSDLNSVSVTSADLLSGSQLLSFIYPNDSGLEAPYLANRHELKLYGIESLHEFHTQVGIPYVWVQKLGGLNFLPETTSYPKINNDTAFFMVEDCLKRIKKRVLSRLILVRILGQLEKCEVVLEPEFFKFFPAQIYTKITSWEKIPFVDYKSFPQVQHLLDDDLVHSSDAFYKACMSYGDLVAEALISVPVCYPTVSPLFSLSLTAEGLTNLNNLDVKQIETEVNVFAVDMLADVETPSHRLQLLPLQVQRLLLCLDVYKDYTGGDTRNRKCLRETKFSTRSRAFRYMPELDIFSQRS